MANKDQIFQTSNATRWKSVQWTGRIILMIMVFLLVVTVLAVINGNNPNLPNIQAKDKYYQSKLDPSNKLTLATPLNKKYKGFRDFLLKKEKEDSLNAGKNKPNISLIRAAFYTPWLAGSLADLVKNADKLNTVYPEWFFIDTITKTLQTRIDMAGLSVMKQNNLSIQPIFNNYHSYRNAQGDSGYFDAGLAHSILSDSVKRKHIIQQIADSLKFYGLQGLNVDFEDLTESRNETITAFQKELYEALHPGGLLLSMDIQSKNEDYDIKKLADYNDYIILMAYDQYSDETGAGPISSQKWIEQQLDWMDDRIDPSKIILGVAGYSRDWVDEEGEDGKRHKRVDDFTYSAAIDKARIAAVNIEFDNTTYNLHYSYNDDPTDSSSETRHSVWFTDAATTFNILRFSDDYGTAGTALWHLGGEDPRMWTYYGRSLSTSSLREHPFDFNLFSSLLPDPDKKPTAVGEGELLEIIYSPQTGNIKLEIDSTEMLIAEQKYLELPSGYVYRKFAEDKTPMGPGHKMILTFDDGPDPEYTPKILDILAKEKIPATFFIVGLNAESNIPLLNRIYDNGYEIGNHTFTHHNIAKMSPERADLELKSTRLLIECITGHSTILFRAPYNADSEPQTFEEIEPIARSKKDNYITVGESIDPNDWDPKMNADSIFDRTVRIAESNDASIILLHDAGGPRGATIEALPRIIEYFKKRGCKFTSIADLMGKTKEDVMPTVKRSWINTLNFFFAEAYYWAGHILFALFIVGIIFSVGRMLLMGLLASIQIRREKRLAILVPGTLTKFPLVSVIVPAYNEEVNVERTINSLLQQDYPNLEIVFVDDGSTDNTFEKVKEAFESFPNVHIHKKTNGGKATALNYGIDLANSEFVVCIDADTQLKSDAVMRLMEKFTDDNVGAVAGNVKVGNEVNMITRWQSIEYITSQNFDRRAFDLLNCIIVVPGAIGGFRKEAIIKAGGFTSDTLAEDCDLTMRMHRLGYKVRNCGAAISYTEAPETMRQFMKQRFRWSFGVMQSFWKHRDAVFNPRYKSFGMVALPNILIFQMILPFLAPLADLILVFSLLAAGFGIIQSSLPHIIFYYLIFTVVDVAGAALAFAFEKEDYKKLLWMIPQRLIYRQLMYYIVLKSFSKALKGEMQGWGVLKRTGNVKQMATV